MTVNRYVCVKKGNYPVETTLLHSHISGNCFQSRHVSFLYYVNALVGLSHQSANIGGRIDKGVYSVAWGFSERGLGI